MVNFLKNLIDRRSQEKILSFLLVFSLGISSLSSQVMNKSAQAKETQIENPYILEEDQSRIGKIFDKKGYLLSDNDTLLNLNPNFITLKVEKQRKVSRRMKIILTAYSSTFFECDGSPFRTASGSHVKDGIVATNFLAFGTKIKIPEIFGDRIFIVEDRMAKRYWYRVDIWMSNYETAVKFGKRYSEIEILN